MPSTTTAPTQTPAAQLAAEVVYRRTFPQALFALIIPIALGANVLVVQPLTREGFLFPSQPRALIASLLLWAIWLGICWGFVWQARRSHLKLSAQGLNYISDLSIRLTEIQTKVFLRWSDISEIAVVDPFPGYLLITLKGKENAEGEGSWPERRIKVNFSQLNVKFNDLERELEARLLRPVTHLSFTDAGKEYPEELDVPVALKGYAEQDALGPVEFGPNKNVKWKLTLGSIALAVYTVLFCLLSTESQWLTPGRVVGLAMAGLLLLGCGLVVWALVNSRLKLGNIGIVSRIGLDRGSFIKWSQVAGVSVRTSIYTGDLAIVLQVKNPDSSLYDYRNIADRYEITKNDKKPGEFVIPLEPYGLELREILPEILNRLAIAQQERKPL